MTGGAPERRRSRPRGDSAAGFCVRGGAPNRAPWGRGWAPAGGPAVLGGCPDHGVSRRPTPPGGPTPACRPAGARGESRVAAGGNTAEAGGRRPESPAGLPGLAPPGPPPPWAASRRADRPEESRCGPPSGVDRPAGASGVRGPTGMDPSAGSALFAGSARFAGYGGAVEYAGPASAGKVAAGSDASGGCAPAGEDVPALPSGRGAAGTPIGFSSSAEVATRPAPTRSCDSKWPAASTIPAAVLCRLSSIARRLASNWSACGLNSLANATPRSSSPQVPSACANEARSPA